MLRFCDGTRSIETEGNLTPSPPEHSHSLRISNEKSSLSEIGVYPLCYPIADAWRSQVEHFVHCGAQYTPADCRSGPKCVSDLVETSTMGRSFAKHRAKIGQWKKVSVHRPRQSPHDVNLGLPAFRQQLDLRELFAEFPPASSDAIDDERLTANIRVALSSYQSARVRHVPRKEFRDAADAILGAVKALHAELKRAEARDPARAAVMHRVDEITVRATSVVFKAELDDLSDALKKVLKSEPERGNLLDEAARALVYDLSVIYQWRRHRKPSREFDHSIEWHRRNTDGRPLRERELDGNDFARFIFLIEKAYLAGLRAYLIRRQKPAGEALSARDLNARTAKFDFGAIRQAVISIVDRRRAEKWRS